MNIKITCNKHSGESESVMLSSYCSALDGSLADLFTIPCFDNVQTTKWAEHSGEVANFSIAKSQAINFNIKVFGKVADLVALNVLLSDSVGTEKEQVIEAEFDDINGQKRTLVIPAEYQKMSSFSALSLDGTGENTIATTNLEFKCVKNEFPEDSFDSFFGVLSNWTANGRITKTEAIKKSIQGNRYSFYELDEDEIKELGKITDIDDFFWQSEMCLGSLGFTVLRGYLQSAYSPCEQNAPLTLKTIESESIIRSNSDKFQSRDVTLKLAVRQPNTLAVIQCIGMLKRYFYTVLKRTNNALVFLDEREGIAFKCYPKACKVDKWTNRGYAEFTLTLRSTDEIKTHFGEPPVEEAPEPEEVVKYKPVNLTIWYSNVIDRLEPFVLKNQCRIYTYGATGGDTPRIPIGAVLVGYSEGSQIDNISFSYPPLNYCGNGVRIMGSVTEEISYDDLRSGRWKSKVRTNGEIECAFATAMSALQLTTATVGEGLKVDYVSGATQETWDTALAELKDEAHGASSAELWKRYFSTRMWNAIKGNL